MVEAVKPLIQFTDEAKINHSINLAQQVIIRNQALKRDHLKLALVGCGAFRHTQLIQPEPIKSRKTAKMHNGGKADEADLDDIRADDLLRKTGCPRALIWMLSQTVVFGRRSMTALSPIQPMLRSAPMTALRALKSAVAIKAAFACQ